MMPPSSIQADVTAADKAEEGHDDDGGDRKRFVTYYLKPWSVETRYFLPFSRPQVKVGRMKRSTSHLALFLVLLGLCCACLSSAFAPPRSCHHVQQRASSNEPRLVSRNMIDDDDDRTIEEVERDASRKVASKLLFSWNFSGAITKAAWTFVLIGFLLNLFGYDYVFDNENIWSLRIDTMENKQFQQELVKSSKNK